MNKEELTEVTRSEKKSSGVFWFGKQKVISNRTFELPIEIGELNVFLKAEVVEGDIP